MVVVVGLLVGGGDEEEGSGCCWFGRRRSVVRRLRRVGRGGAGIGGRGWWRRLFDVLPVVFWLGSIKSDIV